MIPVSMGSPVDLKGVANLLDDIVDYFPNPSARKCSGTDTKSGKAFDANYDQVVSMGEILSTQIVAVYLLKQGLPVEWWNRASCPNP